MQAKIETLKDERTVVWILLWAVIALGVLYVYFMNQTVFNVAKRAHLEQNIASLSANISELEFKNISQRNNIDIALAYSLGYTEIKNPHYIPKTTVATRVALKAIE